MKSKAAVDVMLLGHFSKDRLVIDDEVEICPGGSIYYGSIPLRHLGLSAAVVTRLHPDDFSFLDELREEGVQVFARPAPATSSVANIYRSADMERRICKLQSFAGPFQKADLPDLTAQIYLVVPIIAGEVDLELLQWVAQRGPVGLDVQGFVRVPQRGELVFQPWPDMAEGLACVTYLKVDRAEAELLTGKSDLRAAARELAAYGPREVLVTQSSGVTVYAEGKLYTAPFTPRSLAGRTGRGDTCFATYVGRRLIASPEEATRTAAAITTLKQEKPGPWRGTLDDVAALLADERRPPSVRGIM